MHILFTGGGTLGPVTPLLAVAEVLNAECRMQNAELRMIWIGTRKGPERKLVEQAGIAFSWIWAPKWRRYFDLKNLLMPILLVYSFIISLVLLLFRRPDVIVTAGGFVGVPVVWAAWWLRMFGIRIPVLLHNQDVRWSLANKLVAPFVKKITYALPDTVPARWTCKAVWTGNPVRSSVLSGKKERGLKLCGFADRVPTIMVVGGGTGAQRLNEILAEALPELVKKYQVIHVTGKNKGSGVRGQVSEHYCAFEFVTSEMGDLLAAADLVVTRAGMGFLTELAARGKPMMIVPIPGSHQEENARYFKNKKAAIVLNQAQMTGGKLIKAIDTLFDELDTMQEMGERARELSKSDAAQCMADEVQRLAKK